MTPRGVMRPRASASTTAIRMARSASFGRRETASKGSIPAHNLALVNAKGMARLFLNFAADMQHRPNWATGIGLLIIHLGAILAFFPMFFSWSAIGAAIVITWVTGGFGITLCYHRALTHRALRMVRPVEYATAIF